MRNVRVVLLAPALACGAASAALGDVAPGPGQAVTIGVVLLALLGLAALALAGLVVGVIVLLRRRSKRRGRDAPPEG